MAIRVEVNARGPLFEPGRAQVAVDHMLDQAKQDVAAQGLANWHANLDTSIRHPTPYYETQIHTYRRGDDQVVDDRGIIYGYWLEGIGSRNSPVTRFPGYHAMARAVATLRGQIPGLLERLARKLVEELTR